MPNWCDNTVYLQHNDASMIERAEQAFMRGELMNEFHPCPKELHDTVAGFCGAGTYEQELLEFKQTLNIKWFGSKNWYDWQVSHWGSKWDVGMSCGGGDGNVYKESANSISLSFLSAWSPPIQFYEKLVYLGFTVRAYYYESGMSFCGAWSDDYDESYQITGNSKWVTENIPDEIDQIFNISSSMVEWDIEHLQESIDELIEKIEGEGCEETCAKYKAELEELRAELEELLV